MADEVTETDDGLLIGDEGGRGRAKSDMSWSDVSIDSSCDVLPRVEARVDETVEEGVPGLDGALRFERREGVPDAVERGEDILNPKFDSATK